MSRRDKIQMTDEETHQFLLEQKTITVVSNGSNGFPHPMPMWFSVEKDNTIRMATYESSQKVRNIERDAKVSLLCESGTDYDKLRGVVIYGQAELIKDLELAIDTLIVASGMPPETRSNPDVRKAMVERARKRVVIEVKPQRIVTWNHEKLGGVY